ncbi:DUF3363 domain-containing protein (plasmid) [Xanthomonas oryzae pv. oryzae]|nr:DUF3363 domain-containing protein [Xanthomonas oryzae]WFC26922.1 DUF3363 domain-containing protein [Xanthomonas oryzae pv. oryzae]
MVGSEKRSSAGPDQRAGKGGQGASSTDKPLRVRLSKGRQARNNSQVNEVISRVKSAAKRAARTGRISGATTHHAGRGAGVRINTGSRQQRVTIKARVVAAPRVGAKAAMQRHVDYAQRHGVDKDGGPARPFTDTGELTREQTSQFVDRAEPDRHSFRFIVSPEDGASLNLESYTRDLMQQMEQDLGTKLDWMAVAHHDTDNPHVHIIVRGVDDKGGDLVISRDYISNGMRERARELATRELGYRSDIDIYRSAAKEVTQERWTGLDASMLREQQSRESGLIHAGKVHADPFRNAQRQLRLQRLAILREHGLATEQMPGRWKIHANAPEAMRAMAQERRLATELKPHIDAERSRRGLLADKDSLKAAPVQGVILDRGLADKLSGTEYIIVGGFDGQVHYATLSMHSERHMPERGRIGDTVELGTYTPPAATSADKNVLRRLKSGVYLPDAHLAEVKAWDPKRLPANATPESYIDAHVNRMEALASRGHVTKLPDGTFRVPADLLARLDGDPAIARDKNSFVRLDVKAQGSLNRQSQVIGRTFLDDQLAAGRLEQLKNTTIRTRTQMQLLDALEARADRLVELQLAQRTPAGVRLKAGFDDELRDMERAMVHKHQVAGLLKPHLRAERSQSGRLADEKSLETSGPVQGVILDRGQADKRSGAEYVIVAGFDGQVHYATLSAPSERHLVERGQIGDTVTLDSYTPPVATAADKNVLRRLQDEIYSPEAHLEEVKEWDPKRLPGNATPESYIEAHVRRMDALAHRGHVTKLEDGTFQVPADLVERVNADPTLSDPKRAFVRLDVLGKGPLPQQSQVIARTFLDEQLAAGRLEQMKGATSRTRTQAQFLEALEARTDRLVALRMAERTPVGVRLKAGFDEDMRGMELGEAQKRLASKYGQPVNLDVARRFQGTVEAIENLPSGPHAVIVQNGTFAVVPAKDGLQGQLGNTVAVQLAKGQSMNQSFQSVRIRFAAMDVLDKGKSLGLTRS